MSRFPLVELVSDRTACANSTPRDSKSQFPERVNRDENETEKCCVVTESNEAPFSTSDDRD